MKLTKEQVEGLKDTLYASKDEAFGLALLTLMMHELDRVKDILIIPGGGDIVALQGEAQAYLRILKYLKERTVAIKQV